MDMQPKLRKDLLTSELKESDGATSVVIKDPVANKFFKLSRREYEFLRLFDGKISVDDGVELFRRRGQFITPEEANLIIDKASQTGLALGGKFNNAAYLGSAKERIKEAERAKIFSSVYFLYIPVLNPDRFLDKTVWIYKLLANRITLWVLLALIPGALYFVITGYQRMDREYLYFFNLENLVYLWLTIAFTKLIHEFSHAYMAKSFGLHVPQMGVAFLIFFPCLYCNTSDAWSLADRRQRIAISAAGILAETALAIISTYIWYYSRPGMINSIAFYLMAISFVSTILFNGNPLIKFDGYFMLIDYLRIPNLQTKAFGYIKYLFWNRVLGSASITNNAQDAREQTIFLTYGIAAFIYRIFLYAGICVTVYYSFDKLLGALLGAFAIILFVFKPILKGIGTVFTRKKELSPRPLGAVVFVAILVCAGILLTVPLSSKSIYPCYVASTRIQKLATPLKSSISRVHIRQGSFVRKGDILLELNPSFLRLALYKKEMQRNVGVKQVEVTLVDLKEMPKAISRQIEVYQVDDEIQRLHEELKIAKEGVRAPFDGVITTLDYRVQPGFMPGEGAIVGQLESPDHTVIYALVPEKDRHLIRVGMNVEMWMPIGNGIKFNSRIENIRSYSEKDLKDSPFSSRVGGELATETKSEKLKDAPLEAQYLCEVSIPKTQAGIPLGMTGKISIPAPPQSILSRNIDRFLRTFTKETTL